MINKKIRNMLHDVIFKSDSFSGRLFDIVLLWLILGSIVLLMMQSVESIALKWGDVFRGFEYFLTLIFLIEYVLRVYSSKRRFGYIISFFGIIDFISIVPAAIILCLGGVQYLFVMRAFRLLRVFRIFKLSKYLHEGEVLARALKASRYKITLFIGVVLSSVIIMGTVMFVVEGAENGFTSIPLSIYWAIVTMTTVGYGDIAPQTIAGQIISSVIMILGYAIIAVPTGIVTVELSQGSQINVTICPRCGLDKHDKDARFCKRCGERISR
ncbi:MAG: ion transporter [Spirochaetes bacterium]|nr:ion transporter [Spirochaetota bacterium]MBN2770120.1 ion transporter [Spirochaetota bacterium]